MINAIGMYSAFEKSLCTYNGARSDVHERLYRPEPVYLVALYGERFNFFGHLHVLLPDRYLSLAPTCAMILMDSAA
jgi:hypothetical protein